MNDIFQTNRDTHKLLRIDRILSNFGFCTRKQARVWVKDGRVLVSGVPADDVSDKADPHTVTVDEAPLDHPGGIYMAFHKPAGYICSHDPGEGSIIYDLLPPSWITRDPVVSSVGRLDKDASGLLLLTDDTVLSHRLMSPSRHVAKVYRVDVDKELAPDLIAVFSAGTLMLEKENTPLLPAELVIESPTRGLVTLHEGRYHQIKRMFAACGYLVQALHRIKIGKMDIGDLPEGMFKEFGPEDV